MARILEQRDERQDQEEDDHPEGEVTKVRIHLDLSIPADVRGNQLRPAVRVNLGMAPADAK